jgi:hypothetical protein
MLFLAYLTCYGYLHPLGFGLIKLDLKTKSENGLVSYPTHMEDRYLLLINRCL